MAVRRTARPTSHGGAIELPDHPPFPGFAPEGLRFLRQLRKNNSREWFTPERKHTYEVHLVEPMRQLLAELSARCADEGLPYSPDPTRSIFRLYRDTRFSKDKTPYKTHIGASIPFASEKREGIGNYIHIEPGGCFFGGGAYFMDSGRLRRLRESIDRDPSELRSILEDLARNVGPLEGEQLRRAPAGYDEQHAAIDLLRYKQMWCGRKIADDVVTTPELIDELMTLTRALTPFNTYLFDAMCR